MPIPVEIMFGNNLADGGQNQGRFYGMPQTIQPERRLMLAILEAAIEDIINGNSVGKTKGHIADAHRVKAADARQWLTSYEDDWLYAFRSICDHLGLNASSISKKILTEQIVIGPLGFRYYRDVLAPGKKDSRNHRRHSLRKIY